MQGAICPWFYQIDGRHKGLIHLSQDKRKRRVVSVDLQDLFKVTKSIFLALKEGKGFFVVHALVY